MRLVGWCMLGLVACTSDPVDPIDAGVSDAGVPEAGLPVDTGSEPLDAGVLDAAPADVGIDPNSAVGRGQVLYGTYCGFCHGESGEGYIADNANALAHQEFLSTASDFFLWVSVVEGRPGTPMSPWGEAKGGPLTNDNVWDIVAYMRRWQDLPDNNVDGMAVDGDALAGADTYARMQCGTCHGQEGEGVTAMSLNNPWFHQVASDGFIYHAIAKGRAPTPMPAYDDVLTPQEIADLVAYIRTWQRDPNEQPPEDPFVPDWEDHLINPDGPPAEFEPRVVEWEGAEFPEEYVSVAQVYAAMQEGKSFTLVDARVIPDYLYGHISGAVSAPFDQIDRAAEVLTRDRWVITYCGCPHAVSGLARTALKRAGFERVAVLDEGYYYWTDQMYPNCGGRERYCD